MRTFRIVVLFYFFSIPFISAQIGLDSIQVSKLDSSIVSIITDGNPSGTGFFISSEGDVCSNWHVIDGANKIEIKLRSGKVYSVKIDPKFIGNKATVLDYVLLKPNNPITRDSNGFYKLGSWKDINEGNLVYTSGFPAGIDQRFTSVGILSTKFDKDESFYLSNGDSIVYNRKSAYLNLTMNKGNSGGPIIKYSKEGDEVVIGIASFIINPNSMNIEQALLMSRIFSGNGITLSSNDTITLNRKRIPVKLDQTEINKNLALALYYNSVGISGCISIDHFKEEYFK